ncbi:MAG: HEPN domain-containing protein [Nanoarchaeota archaeon]
MEVEEIEKITKDSEELDRKIDYFTKLKLIRDKKLDVESIKGHIEKAENNLKFVLDNINLGYYDWCITGCYYSMYHIAIALILSKEKQSKNHDASICLLIKYYYMNGISEEDIEMLNEFFINYQDLLFYVESKEKRKEASYSTEYRFDKEEVENMRLKSIEFVDKAKNILKGMDLL